MNQNDPWEKQPEETHKSYMAFCVYRDLGFYRSLEKARLELGQNQHYIKWLKVWSVKFDWQARVKSFDLHLEAKQRKVWEDKLIQRRLDHQEAELEKTQKLNAYIGKLFESAQEAPLETVVKEIYVRDEQGSVLESTKTTYKPHDIAANIQAKIEQHSKLGRRALEMPFVTQLEQLNGESSIEKLARMQQQQEEFDYSNLSDEELKLFSELIGKLRKPKEDIVIPLAS